ncbi:MAG: hypothetical protein ACYS76_10270 [Planctomycetota bacterium]|jgi:hypothetical protein
MQGNIRGEDEFVSDVQRVEAILGRRDDDGTGEGLSECAGDADFDGGPLHGPVTAAPAAEEIDVEG